MTTTLSMAFDKIFFQYDIMSKEIAPIVGISHATMSRWRTGCSEPLTDRIPRLANALDSLCVGGGVMLLDLTFGFSFSEQLNPPMVVSDALSQVFASYRMTGTQVAAKAGTSGSTVTRWKLGHNSPNLYQAQNLSKALDIVRPGAGRLFLELLTGRTIKV
jgi:DNA-binding Xre family transcriptional regulator